MPTTAKGFFSKEEESRIKTAILKAELDTSGEIRVHIENHCKIDPLDRAVFVFDTLKMNKTEQRNGVLIYIAVKDKKFAIIGDSGINGVVDANYWDDIKTLMTEHFKRGEFVFGMEKGIERIGTKLKTHFPYHINDVNELNDDISFG